MNLVKQLELELAHSSKQLIEDKANYQKMKALVRDSLSVYLSLCLSVSLSLSQVLSLLFSLSLSFSLFFYHPHLLSLSLSFSLSLY